MPSSFPPLKRDPTEGRNPTALLPTTTVLSSVSASPDIAKSLNGYALLVENCVARRSSLLPSIGVSLDDLKDLANDLRTMHDKALENNPDNASDDA